MIKIFLKYCLYDFCIDVIFNKLETNFKSADVSKIPRKGYFFTRITHAFRDEYYYNCIIKNVQVKRNSNNERYYVISFSYEYCDGSYFDKSDMVEEYMENIETYGEDEADALSGDVSSVQTHNGILSVMHDNYGFYK